MIVLQDTLAGKPVSATMRDFSDEYTDLAAGSAMMGSGWLDEALSSTIPVGRD